MTTKLGIEHMWMQPAFDRAVAEAIKSPCAKSKRGVVIFDHSGYVLSPSKRVEIVGHNRPPSGMACDGSDVCRSSCNKLCLHAEHVAIDQLLWPDNWHVDTITYGLQLLHVKVVDGEAVASGPPSCWQCSREILDCPFIRDVWLSHEDGLRSYTKMEFHEATLRHCGLPIIREGA